MQKEKHKERDTPVTENEPAYFKKFREKYDTTEPAYFRKFKEDFNTTEPTYFKEFKENFDSVEPAYFKKFKEYVAGEFRGVHGEVRLMKDEICGIKNEISEIKDEIIVINGKLDMHFEAIGELKVEMTKVNILLNDKKADRRDVEKLEKRTGKLEGLAFA